MDGDVSDIFRGFQQQMTARMAGARRQGAAAETAVVGECIQTLAQLHAFVNDTASHEQVVEEPGYEDGADPPTPSKKKASSLENVTYPTRDEEMYAVASCSHPKHMKLREGHVVIRWKEGPKWKCDDENSECASCHVKFTMILRKHHCRGCGRVLCDTCCSHRVWKLDHAVYRDAVAVCGECVWAIRHTHHTRTLLRRWCHDRHTHYRHVVMDGDLGNREWVQGVCNQTERDVPALSLTAAGGAKKVVRGLGRGSGGSEMEAPMGYVSATFECTTDQNPDILGKLLVGRTACVFVRGDGSSRGVFPYGTIRYITRFSSMRMLMVVDSLFVVTDVGAMAFLFSNNLTSLDEAYNTLLSMWHQFQFSPSSVSDVTGTVLGKVPPILRTQWHHWRGGVNGSVIGVGELAVRGLMGHIKQWYHAVLTRDELVLFVSPDPDAALVETLPLWLIRELSHTPGTTVLDVDTVVGTTHKLMAPTSEEAYVWVSHLRRASQVQSQRLLFDATVERCHRLPPVTPSPPTASSPSTPQQTPPSMIGTVVVNMRSGEVALMDCAAGCTTDGTSSSGLRVTISSVDVATVVKRGDKTVEMRWQLPSQTSSSSESEYSAGWHDGDLVRVAVALDTPFDCELLQLCISACQIHNGGTNMMRSLVKRSTGFEGETQYVWLMLVSAQLILSCHTQSHNRLVSVIDVAFIDCRLSGDRTLIVLLPDHDCERWEFVSERECVMFSEELRQRIKLAKPATPSLRGGRTPRRPLPSPRTNTSLPPPLPFLEDLANTPSTPTPISKLTFPTTPDVHIGLSAHMVSPPHGTSVLDVEKGIVDQSEQALAAEGEENEDEDVDETTAGEREFPKSALALVQHLLQSSQVTTAFPELAASGSSIIPQTVPAWMNTGELQKVLDDLPGLLGNSGIPVDPNTADSLKQALTAVKGQLQDGRGDVDAATRIQEALGPLQSFLDSSGIAVQGRKFAMSATPAAIGSFVETGTRALKRLGLDPSAMSSPHDAIGRLSTILHDPEQREEFVLQLKEWVVDFLVQFVPNLRIPTVTGEKESVSYVIDHVILSEFRVNGEDVHLTVSPTTRQVHFEAENMRFAVVGCRWRLAQKGFPYLSASGIADCSSHSLRLNLKCHLNLPTPAETSAQTEASDSQGGAVPTVTVEHATVSLDEVSLRIRGTIIGPLANIATSMFADVVRRSIEAQLNKSLQQHTSTLVKSLNDKIAQMLPVVEKNALFTQAMQHIRKKDEPLPVLTATTSKISNK